MQSPRKRLKLWSYYRICKAKWMKEERKKPIRIKSKALNIFQSEKNRCQSHEHNAFGHIFWKVRIVGGEKSSHKLERNPTTIIRTEWLFHVMRTILVMLWDYLGSRGGGERSSQRLRDSQMPSRHETGLHVFRYRRKSLCQNM